jgi:zinc transport system substrate-binding protein
LKRLILSLCFLLLLTGCVPVREEPAPDDGRLQIVASIFPPYDFVREIAGDRVHLSLLLPPGAESHSFAPTAKDILGIQDSDLFIRVGGESEAWIDKVLSSIDTTSTTVLSLMDVVEVVEEELVEGMEPEPDSAEDHGNAAYDEHVWTSPRNAALIVTALEEALCELDSANAAYYRQNAAAYRDRLAQLDRRFVEIVEAGQRDTIVFGDRFPFRYFADAYGLTYYAAFPGCAAETEPSAATVAFLLEKIRAENIPVVFHIELSSQKMADVLCRDTGAKKLLFHSCHNLSLEDFEAGETYLSLMSRNADNLTLALGSSS